MRPIVALVLAVLALTVSPLFVRWADAPGVVKSLYRMVIAASIITPLAIYKLSKGELVIDKRLVFPILAGVFSAIDHTLWTTSIEKTAVANATLLNNITPLWVAIFAGVIWHEKLNYKFWIGLCLLFVGALMVLGNSLVFSPESIQGDLLAITSSFFYAGFYLLTQTGRKKLDPISFLWIMLISAAICLLVFTLVTGAPLFGYSKVTYIVFFSSAVISQLGGYYLLAYALGRIPSTVVTPTMVLQPVLTAIIAVPLLGEVLSALQIIGGSLVLGGILVIHGERRVFDGGPKTEDGFFDGGPKTEDGFFDGGLKTEDGERSNKLIGDNAGSRS